MRVGNRSESVLPGTTRRQADSDGRGQSAVIGIALLFTIVLLTSIVIIHVGAPTLSDTRTAVDVDRAEHAMSQLDTQASATALNADGAESRTVNFGRVERQGGLQTTQNSWLRVELLDATTGVPTTVANASLGTVQYTNGDTTIGYEGGGVWRSDRGGSVMRSPPEYHFRAGRNGNGTLTLPILSVQGDRTLPDTVHVSRAGQVERKFPNPSRGQTNKIEQAKVRVTVKSAYYAAWGRYFERAAGGIVEIDHTRQTASVTYLSVSRWIGLDSGILATSGLGEIRLTGNSIYIDSYNSSQGSYSATHGSEGSLTAVHDVVTKGTSNIEGDIRSGSDVELGGSTTIDGTVYYTDSYSHKGDAVSGGFQQIDGVAAIEPIDGYVHQSIAAARDTNNNSDAAVISSNQLTGSGTLTAGTYYLSDLTLGPGEQLDIDTTGGDVTIAVADTVSVVGGGGGSSTARINVLGDGDVTVFVNGDDPVDLEVGKNGRVDVPVERAGQFRVYGTKDFDAVLTSNQGNKLRFEGVIYAPAGQTGTGSVTIGQAEFYGAIITGDLTIKQGAEIHYDLGLANDRFPRSPTVARLVFMHVTVHPVSVT